MDDKELEDSRARLVLRTSVDLCFTDPTVDDCLMSCIEAKYDSSLVNHKKERTGVLEIWEMK